MSHVRRLGMLGVFALLFTVGHLTASAEDGKDGIKTVFVIAMENHDWTQPANQFSGGIQQDLGAGTVLDVAYVGALGRDLIERNRNPLPYGQVRQACPHRGIT